MMFLVYVSNKSVIQKSVYFFKFMKQVHNTKYSADNIFNIIVLVFIKI